MADEVSMEPESSKGGATSREATTTTEDAPTAALPEGASQPTSSTPSRSALLHYRNVHPTDVPKCLELETEWKPPLEASKKADLQYRQHHAAHYFRCALMMQHEHHDAHHVDDGWWEDPTHMVGFVCATRVHSIAEYVESPNKHTAHAPLLVLHSVVVQQEYRPSTTQNADNDGDDHVDPAGIVSAMLQEYIQYIRQQCHQHLIPPIQKIVKLTKTQWIPLYATCGFASIVPCGALVPGRWEMACLVSSTTKEDDDPKDVQKKECFVVNAFCGNDSNNIQGNPAAVVLVDSNDNHWIWDAPDTDAWCQQVAAQFNLSETAFVGPRRKNNSDEYHIRYFTPTTKIALCGHATLAAAAAVVGAKDNGNAGNINNNANNTLLFWTSSDPEVPALSVRILAESQQQQNTETTTIMSGGDAPPLSNESSSGIATEETPIASSAPLSSSLTKTISMSFPIQSIVELKENHVQAAMDMLHQAIGGDTSIVPLFVGLVPSLGDLLMEIKPSDMLKLDECPIQTSAFVVQDTSMIPGYTRGVILCSVADEDEAAQRRIRPRLSSSMHEGAQLSTSSRGSLERSDSLEYYSDHDRPLTEQERQDYHVERLQRLQQSVDVWSRFFGPLAGIPEDPVTGSAHAALAPYFGTKLSKTRLIAIQRSTRGGRIECQLPETFLTEEGGNNLENASGQVVLTGQAKIVVKGSLWM